MDLRSELDAVEGVVQAMSSLIDKVLDTLNLIPPIVDRTAENNIERRDVERLEMVVMDALRALGALSNRVYTMEDLIFFLKRAVDSNKRSDNKPDAPPKAESPVVQDPCNIPDENDIDNCTEELAECSLDAEYVADGAGVAMVADTPQKGRRRSRSATRMIKKVIRRFSHSRSRLPNVDLGQGDADTTLPLEK
ncbi:hypothetical protein Aduo_014349 [Ancylostoma duodenale]